MATTFSAGMPILNALEISTKTTNNLFYQDIIINIRDNIATGEQFNYAMQKTLAFPDVIIQLVAIGEEAGKLDAMMNKAASIYEDDVEMTLDNLQSLLEPIIMSILGVLIGGLVIAMYLPIFKMGQIF